MQDYKEYWLPEVAKKRAEVAAKTSASRKSNTTSTTDAAKIKKLEAELQKARRELEQRKDQTKDDDDDDEEDQAQDEEHKLQQLKKQIEQTTKMLNEIGEEDELLRATFQSTLDTCKQRKAELEKKRDETKPHSSRLQRAEAALEKAKSKVKEAEAQLAKDHEALDTILEQIRKNTAERDRLAKEAEEADKYLVSLGTHNQDETEGATKNQAVVQSFLQHALARCNQEQAQGLKGLETLFTASMAELFVAPPKVPTDAGAPQQQQPQQQEEQTIPVAMEMEMETIVVDPVEHQQALAKWARTQPTKREGQSQEEFDKLKADWMQQAPMQCQKRPKVQHAATGTTSSPSITKAGASTASTDRGDGKKQG